MSEKAVFCFQCHFKNSFQDRLSFRTECEKCGADLHICKNCSFYDESAYNECRESSAERVLNKETNNVCEYFCPKDSSSEKKKDSQELLKQAEALFKKKENK